MISPSQQFVLTAITFDSPYLIQIMDHNGEVIVTVASPQNTTKIDQFNIWNGYGVDQDGIETPPDTIIKIDNGEIDIAWKMSVSLAYTRAYQILIKTNG